MRCSAATSSARTWRRATDGAARLRHAASAAITVAALRRARRARRLPLRRFGERGGDGVGERALGVVAEGLFGGGDGGLLLGVAHHRRAAAAAGGAVLGRV